MKGSAHKIEATKKKYSQKVFPILLDTSLYPLM
jgi:hypothetical protein